MNQKWVEIFLLFLQDRSADAAHDLSHIKRVVANATLLGQLEGAEMGVVLPAAWLHDCVSVPKNSPLRSQASRMAAEKAGQFLRAREYNEGGIAAIEHAVAAHSFSAQIAPQTIEAKVVQDADRLDALGAIGIARTFITGATLGIPFLDADEPLPVTRTPHDQISMIDHFYTKLLTLADTMQTQAGRTEALQRTQFMRYFLAQLAAEIGV
jgi:uncharacterized protein